MKVTILVSIMLLIAAMTYAQVGINMDDSAPESGTILHVKGDASHTKVKFENVTDGVQINDYTLPANDGSSEQVLQTNGSGTVSWVPMSSGSGNNGVALGSSMATVYMVSHNMFTPHTNNCSSDEAFVALYSGATVGFCIEKNERPAQYWTDAIRTCLAEGKRLPEPFEWQTACDQAGTLGLNNMTDNWEWASNFPIPAYDGGNFGVGATVFGSGGCNDATWGWLGYGDSSRTSNVFRCVH